MVNHIGWDDQRAFLAVFDEGSLSGAARRLGLTQPTVRARIAALEHAVGTVLFTRSVNGLVPTDQARALAGSARAMERASEAFYRAASAPPGMVSGSVRVSVAEFVGIEVLPAMLASLRRTHPGIVIEVSLSNSSADLLEQEADIAVRMTAPQQGALVAKRVGAIALGFYASQAYVAENGMPIGYDDLARHGMIGPDRSHADLQVVEALHAGFGREQLVVRTDSHPAQLALARAGLGIAVTHRAVGEGDRNLIAVLPGVALPPLETWIVTHDDLRRLPRVRAVFDHLAAAFTRYAAF